MYIYIRSKPCAEKLGKKRLLRGFVRKKRWGGARCCPCFCVLVLSCSNARFFLWNSQRTSVAGGGKLRVSGKTILAENVATV